jgi:glycosidase
MSPRLRHRAASLFALVAFIAFIACAQVAPRPAAPHAALAPHAASAAAVASFERPVSGPSGAPLAPLPPRPWSDEVLYFVLVDRFADGDGATFPGLDPGAKGTFHGGDLKGLTAHLDELSSLGVTALWVNPLVKNIDGFVTGAGFPDWAYHGYWADDFTRLDPRFGTEADLAALVEAAHARGIRILLDVVYNHAGYGSAMLEDPRTAGFFRTPCGSDDLTSCVAGLPDLATERPEVRDFLLGAQLPWAMRFGLDGFRLDTVKHVDHAFWKEHRRRLQALRPGFFLLGEVWGGDAEVLDPWFAADELDAGIDFAFRGGAIAWLQGRGRTVAYARALEARGKVRSGHLMAHFLSSHDEEGALALLGGDVARFRQAAVLQLTVTGLPVIFYGEEVGRRIGKWPENRSDMPWGERAVKPGAGVARDEALRAFYQRLVAVRRGHVALTRGLHRTLATDGDLLVFLREDPASGDAVVVAVNRGDAPVTARLARPPGWGARKAADALGVSAVTDAGDGAVSVLVGPRGAAVLVAT